MCSISGFTWDDAHLLHRMNDAQRHRGPDGEGIYTDDHVSLGHRRLSIIDLSDNASQPMEGQSGLQVLVNGEIYNHQELRILLSHHIFKSQCDSEVILHGYEEWGIDVLSHLSGMFAGCIYDPSIARLFLFRDRFGIKPLYYTLTPQGLAFASEPTALPVEKIPNEEMIRYFLKTEISDHSRKTFFQDIYQVLPGQYIEYNIPKNYLTLHQWYSPQQDAQISAAASSPDLLRYFLRKAVRSHLVADVPVGSCLSGGLDSTGIVSLINRPMHTFSMVYPNGYEYDESRWINLVDGQSLTKHYVTPTTEDLIHDLPDLIRTQGEPFAGLSIFGQYSIMKKACGTVKVLLDGQGADELFAGYPKYRIAALCDAYGIPACVLNTLSRHVHKKIDFGLTSPFLHSLLLHQIQYSSLPQLLRYEDRNSMRFSIEARVPYLDYDFARLALHVPPWWKIRNNTTKYLLREALAGIIPEPIRQRKDKIGFRTPDEVWLNNSDVLGYLENEGVRNAEELDWKEISVELWRNYIFR